MVDAIHNFANFVKLSDTTEILLGKFVIMRRSAYFRLIECNVPCTSG